jgi:RNA-binding protein
MRAMKSPNLAMRDRKRLRQIAHHLQPVVTVGDAGMTEPIVAETNRALTDHELIKVRVHGDDRDARTRAIDALAKACEAMVIQTIGKIVVLYRRNPEAPPRLSNLARFGARS